MSPRVGLPQPTFFYQNCPFQSIPVWLVYVLKQSRGGGGQSLADMSTKKSILFYALPNQNLKVPIEGVEIWIYKKNKFELH